MKRFKQNIYKQIDEALGDLDNIGVSAAELSNKMKNIEGYTFGHLSVLQLVGVNKRGATYWLCFCNRCKENYVTTTSKSLQSGDCKSCGCLFADSRASYKHGKTNSVEYRAWASMISRCNNETCTSYQYYGEKGIKVCDRWLESFENFHADMGEIVGDKNILDRINPALGYSPDNCRWVNKVLSNHNKKIYSTNTTGYKGVCSYYVDKYRASISSDNKRYAKVGFDTPIEAARWYDDKAIELFGDSAMTNLKLGLLEE